MNLHPRGHVVPASRRIPDLSAWGEATVCSGSAMIRFRLRINSNVIEYRLAIVRSCFRSFQGLSRPPLPSAAAIRRRLSLPEPGVDRSPAAPGTCSPSEVGITVVGGAVSRSAVGRSLLLSGCRSFRRCNSCPRPFPASAGRQPEVGAARSRSCLLSFPWVVCQPLLSTDWGFSTLAKTLPQVATQQSSGGPKVPRTLPAATSSSHAIADERQRVTCQWFAQRSPIPKNRLRCRPTVSQPPEGN